MKKKSIHPKSKIQNLASSTRGFTLIEIMIVVAIISIVSVLTFIDFKSLIAYIRYSGDLNEINFSIKESKIAVANGKVRNVTLEFNEEKNLHLLTSENLEENIDKDGICTSLAPCNLQVLNESMKYNSKTKEEDSDDSTVQIKWQNGQLTDNLIINKINTNGNADNFTLLYETSSPCDYALPTPQYTCVDQGSDKKITYKVSEIDYETDCISTDCADYSPCDFPIFSCDNSGGKKIITYTIPRVSSSKKYEIYLSYFTSNEDENNKSNKSYIVYFANANLYAESVSQVFLDKITATDVGNEDISNPDRSAPEKIEVRYVYPLGKVYFDFYKNDGVTISKNPVKGTTLSFKKENYDEDDTYREIKISD